MNFDKKWGDMSPEEQDAAKSKYGNKQGWRDAKAKSQGYKDLSDKKEQKDQSQNSAMKNSGSSTGQSQGTSTGQSSSQSQQSSKPNSEQSSASYRSPDNNNSNSGRGASQTASRSQGTQAASSGGKSYTMTASGGKVEAPSWYRNLDGSTPGTMQEGLTEESWNKSLDTARANKAQSMADDKKNEMIQSITQNAYKTGSYGDQWGQATAGMTQSQVSGLKQQISADVQNMKETEMEDKQEARYGINQAGGESFTKYGSARDAFASNKEQGDFYMTNPTNDGYDTYGADTTNQANESVADQLVQSGNDFSWADYGMHRNGGKQNSQYNYDAYGGYDNWYNNHSAYSEGGWKGSQNVMDAGAIASGNQQRNDARNQYQLSDEYMKKYGQYDWAQNYYNNNINKQPGQPGVGPDAYSHTVQMN